MTVVIAGGSGFLGGHLARRLAASGHAVTVLSRSGAPQARTAAGVRTVTWNPATSDGDWMSAVATADAVVNLAGASLADGRWNDARKDLLRTSRVQSTRRLVTAVRTAAKRPAVFVQGSAVGFYGTESGDRELDESFPPGDDFLSGLVVAWEAEAHPVSALGARLVIVRSGVVLSRDGGALQKLLPSFRLFLGGPIASGQQYLSWIHRDDWLALVEWAITTAPVTGTLNATAPSPVTNEQFSKALAAALHRPSWLRVPRLALRALVGELADVSLINGQRVVPRRAVELGFRFRYPTIEEALRDAVRNPSAVPGA